MTNKRSKIQVAQRGYVKLLNYLCEIRLTMFFSFYELQRNMNMTSSNVTLTAHLAITLTQTMPTLDGKLRVDASVAKAKALQ